MTNLKSWVEFEKSAQNLYLQNPMKARYSMKYDHKNGTLRLKMTDDSVCLIYQTENSQDMKKIDKFINNLLRHMTSFE